MKVDLKNRLSTERLDAINAMPNVARFRTLASKIKSGNATDQEKAEWKKETEWLNQLPDNVLSESHIPASV